MPKLYFYLKRGKDFSCSLVKKKINIGRSEDNEITIDDPYSSSHHAIIESSDDGFMIRDDSSKNGTFVNGVEIFTKTPLKKGDEVLLGSTRICFDKELLTSVDVSDVPTSHTALNTVIPIDNILKKSDIYQTLGPTSAPADLKQVKAEYNALSVLNEVSNALLLHKPLKELMDQIMELICDHLPMDRGILMIKEGQPPQLIPKIIRIEKEDLKSKSIKVSQSIINMVLDQHSSVLTSDAQSDTRFKEQESVIQSNIHSAMCVPLWNNQEIIGIVYLDRISLLDQFSEDDLKLLTLLSNLAAVKIENAKSIEDAIAKEKLEKELELASQIQQDLLPKEQPASEKFDIAGTNIPCFQVGGDYFDFFSIGPDRIGIVIADVSGKGMGAGLLMAGFRAGLHAEIHHNYAIKKMVEKMNDFVHRDTTTNQFITFFYCELDEKEGKASYVNAGHNPPVVLDKKGKIIRLERCGLCLGMFPGAEYEVNEIPLNIGESALLFTDGIPDSRDEKENDFEEKRMIDIFKKNAKLSAQEIMDKICKEVETFTSGAPQQDDMTLVIIKRIA